MLTTGGRRSHEELVPLAEKLAARGHRVVLHDRRNTGASDVLIEGDEGEEEIWTQDMYELMRQQNALPAFFGGGSSGARTSILFALRHPEAVHGLLLLRVTGGAFAAGRLPENYYGQFIRAAREGGMEAVCAMDQWKERIAANPRNGDYLRRLPAQTFIDVLTRWLQIFEAGVHLPVMGVTEEELGSLDVPTIVIPGNDKVHSSVSGLAAHRLIPGSRLHRLPVEDQDVPLIPFPEWAAPYEDELVRVLADFIGGVVAAEAPRRRA
jgi:pimeloyl-ACP methyl ester carboxylesterase